MQIFNMLTGRGEVSRGMRNMALPAAVISKSNMNQSLLVDLPLIFSPGHRLSADSALSPLSKGRTTTPDHGSASPGTWPCVWLPADSSTAPCATVEPSRRQISGNIWRASSIRPKCQSYDTAMRWRTLATAKTKTCTPKWTCNLVHILE